MPSGLFADLTTGSGGTPTWDQGSGYVTPHTPTDGIQVGGPAVFTGTVAVPAPSASGQAATKGYVDTAVAGGSGQWARVTGALNYVDTVNANDAVFVDGYLAVGATRGDAQGNVVAHYIETDRAFPIFVRTKTAAVTLLQLDSSGNLTIHGGFTFTGSMLAPLATAQFLTTKSDYFEDKNSAKGYLDCTAAGFNFVSNTRVDNVHFRWKRLNGTTTKALWDAVAEDGTTQLAALTATGRFYSAADLVSDSATKGLILKDGAGHYWRVTISTGGVLSTADLGTTLPA